MVDDIETPTPPAPEPDTIKVPPQVKYGICVFETTDDISEPVTHIHTAPGYEKITMGHIGRLLWMAMQHITAEIIHAKFVDASRKTSILKPGR
jgi:hypothetical protein